MDSRKPAISIRDVTLQFGERKILDKVSLDVFPDEIVAIVGPSGTGKSTLIKVITGLLEIKEGTVELNSDRIGLAFQYGALFTSMNVYDNLALPLNHVYRLSPEEIDTRIEAALTMVGLEENGLSYPNELSGGMQKRVGIARALVIEPEIMLYDEPSAGLDPILARKLENDMRRINEERKMASIVVTHELPSIKTLADRVVMLYDGRLVFQGTTEEFFKGDDPFAKQFRERDQTGPISV